MWKLVHELGTSPRRRLVSDCRVPACTFQAEGFLGGFLNSTADGKFRNRLSPSFHSIGRQRLPPLMLTFLTTLSARCWPLGSPLKTPLGSGTHSADCGHVLIIHTKHLVHYFDFGKFAHCPQQRPYERLPSPLQVPPCLFPDYKHNDVPVLPPLSLCCRESIWTALNLQVEVGQIKQQLHNLIA